MDHLKNIWKDPNFRLRFKPSSTSNVNYREAISIARIFLITIETNPDACEFLFQLQRINQMRTLAQFGKIKDGLQIDACSIAPPRIPIGQLESFNLKAN